MAAVAVAAVAADTTAAAAVADTTAAAAVTVGKCIFENA
jgi:hypothetical protein